MDRIAAPLSYIGRAYYPGYALPIAVHTGDGLTPIDPGEPRYVIVYVQRGSGVLQVNGKPMLITAPAALLLDEATRPTILRGNKLQLRSACFHPGIINASFTPDAIRVTRYEGTTMHDAYLLEPFLDPARMGHPMSLSPSVAAQIETAFTRVQAEGETQRDGNWPCRTRSWLIELLFHLRVLADEPAQITLNAASDNRLDQALLIVHERYNTLFTVDELARLCGSNRTTLNDHFRRRTGSSVREYVIALRIQMAAALLRDTLLPITEVMGRVGYENQSNFTRTFRATTGMTPKTYRTAQCWMLNS
ncbi:helix-turn-helix domain-containing protein [Andreprevotia chitinilytica]|uniref:helix-turn-helix domain-containing protein n=1 Tax=Andreprevotia chitinilytica TaxID=396808 RepID=UPI00068DCCAA|nr:AraC family transcriptional regulator [Andreprevotia chitinilytica]